MKKTLCKRLEKYGLVIRNGCENNRETAENYYYISRKIKYAQREIKKEKHPSFSHIGELSDIIKRYSYNATETELYTELTAHSFSDCELRLLYPLIVYCCAEELYLVCQKKTDEKISARVISFMRRCEYFNYEKIFTSLSKTEKQLLYYRDYRISDDKTRAQYRRLLSEYANKRKISEYKALKKLSGENITDVLFEKKHKKASLLYFPLICFFFLFFALSLAFVFYPFEKYSFIPFALALFPLYECSVYLVNYSYSKLFVPFSKASIRKEDIPKDTRCAVVITSLLTGDDDGLFSKLERYYVSNKRHGLVCGILADLPDSDTFDDESDDIILEKAKEKIKKLCEKYGDVFFLFYRNREYSVSEGKFIAYERKRGAVCELCRLLNGEKNKVITYPENSADKLCKTKYLITLDADTVIAPGDAERMIQVAEHPINTPEYDEKKHRVVKGHGILQPCVETSLESSLKTRFSFLSSGAVGIQVYRYARFDVYSEIFKSGIFCGKGLINVEVFCKATDGIFPEEKILSHDIPEGCLMNVGMIPEITFYDSTPSNGISYFKRQNRWIRGDIQSLLAFCKRKIKSAKRTVKNPFTPFDKYKIFDNVRRDITPVFALAALFSGIFFTRHITVSVAVFSLFYLIIPCLVSLFECLVSGAFGVRRKFYSFTLSSFWYGFLTFLYRVSTLAHDAYTSAKAICKGIWRYCFSNRHLLEWVSASSAEKISSKGFFAYCIYCIFSSACGISFLFVPFGIYRAVGILFVLCPFVLYFTSLKREESKKEVSEDDKKTVQKYVNDMWRYFKDNVNEKNGFLPPDNVTIFAGERVAPRTSPTNIGLYLLSALCAYDFKIIGKNELLQRLDKSVGAVENLKKYEGNLYNWYDTETLCCLDGFVSFVDSGNFLCCLVALKEGIKNIEGASKIYQRIDALIENTHLECMFDKSRNMFYIGIDDKNGVTHQNHYDIYMSEERTADFFATAKGVNGFGVMSNSARVVISEKGHIGLASWTGTAFEYFMPVLFLPVFNDSLLYEAVRYAYKAQRSYTANAGNLQDVYGTSESCYYEFDTELNYQYKAHGVPSLGLKNGLSDDLVISPYSSFLMLCMGRSVLDNLENLKKYGAYGKYGFYEAIDFTKSRVKDGYALIKCFMAHHIGMSMVACANFVFDGIFQKRFTSDISVNSSLCLLYEKIPTDTPPYRKNEEYKKEEKTYFLPQTQEQKSPYGCISNSLCRADLTPGGECRLYYGNIMLCPSKKTGKLRFDVLENGGYHNLIGENNGVCDGYVCEFNTSDEEKCTSCASLSVCEDKNVFCIECAFNEGAQGLFSFSPVCEEERVFSSHISYSRLFITAKIKNGILILKRKRHPPKHDLYLALSMCDDFGIIPFEYEISADKVLPFEAEKYAFDVLRPSWVNTQYVCPAVPFVLMKTDRPHVKILLSCSNDESEAVHALHLASVQKNITSSNKSGIKNVFGSSYCDGMVLSSLLEKNIYPSKRSTPSKLDINTLWKHGISGDHPILTLDLTDVKIAKNPPSELLSVLYTHKTLLMKGHRYDTVILYTEQDKYHRDEENKLFDILRLVGVLPLVGRKNGIFALRCEDEDEKRYFLDISFYPSRRCQTVLPCVSTFCKTYENERTYSINGDEIEITNGNAPMPWSFIYSNESFGTLLTQNSLGFTWRGNSQNGKLTRFDSDVIDPCGEEIYAVCGGVLYPLAKNAEKTVFTLSYALYKGSIDKLTYEVCVFCDAEKERKYARVRITNYSAQSKSLELAYTADFVLGKENRTGALFAKKSKKSLTVVNAYERSEAVLYSPDGSISSFDGVKGAVRCVCSLDAVSSRAFYFTLGSFRFEDLSFDKERILYKKALDGYLDVYELHTKNRDFDVFFNKFSKYQALYCRVYARCGFYQNSGAFGFRDQLQDMICIMYSAPEYAREHILRCAAHQYEDGGVTHWWHPGEKETGVKTRCSDDMLWLVYVLGKYVSITGDDSVLFTPVPYLSSPVLAENEYDRYEQLNTSDMKESVYMHCVRAISHVKYGEHGLPLFGTGDWNDGMNNVGGESVWLAWFLYGVLQEASDLARLAGDDAGGEKYKRDAEILYENTENFAYNGKYYIRGTFSDGTLLGDSGCDVDILPQAFAAMYGKNKERITSSLNTVWDTLYDEKNKQLLLFTPAFDERSKYAGYICDYPKGIRENGGQYTHGAIWGAMGFFDAGMTERGFELLNALNPIIRNKDKELFDKYKGEPYVLAGDIYSAPELYGRCGWSWYTGAASWYFTAVLEKLIGYKETKDGFTVNPAYCKDFEKFRLTVRKKGTLYNISSENCEGKIYPFDGKEHTV